MPSPTTKADMEALARLPQEGWFDIRAVSYMVRNPRYRCDRLVEKGLLESRVVGTYPDIKTEWKVIR